MTAPDAALRLSHILILACIASGIGCGGGSPSSGGGNTPPSAPATISSLYSVQQTLDANNNILSSSILVFSGSSAGTVSQTGTITPQAGTAFWSVFADATGNIYVGASTGSGISLVGEILKYPAGSTGAATPQVLVTNVLDRLGHPVVPASFAIDSFGQLYADVGVSVLVYPATLGPDALPQRTIELDEFSYSFAIDTNGMIYVPQMDTIVGINQIDVYSAIPVPSIPTDEFEKPTSVITPSISGFLGGVALDSSHHLYATYNSADGTVAGVAVFAPNVSGPGVVPIRSVSASNTGLRAPVSVAIDAAGDLYVLDLSFQNGALSFPGGLSPAISLFSSSSNGDIGPAARFSSTAWTNSAYATLALH